jgi:hypothetical protein
VEEAPNQFYHYVKNRAITIECSECREQWKRYNETGKYLSFFQLTNILGQISRLVVAEKSNYCVERVSPHHIACLPRSEAEIRLLEVERNVGSALSADDEIALLEKADQMVSAFWNC